MAIYVGQPCSICGNSIEAGEVPGLLPPFTSNEADPLFALSDAVVHESCLQGHLSADRLNKRLKEYDAARCRPIKLCAVCGEAISDPDEYFTLGFLADEAPGAEWNYTMFHVFCLQRWNDLTAVTSWIESEVRANRWTSKYGEWLLSRLRSKPSGNS